MSDTNEVVPTTAEEHFAAAVAPDVTGDLHLIARNPDEMRTAQRQLSTWFEAKAAICEKDAAELEQSRDIAKQNGWKTEATLNRHAGLMRRRVDFYRKCMAAVDAGYCIVPNFDVDVFAIRTNRNPKYRESTNSNVAEQPHESEGPPAGAGFLVSPSPTSEFTGRREPKTNYKGEPIKDEKGIVQTEPIWGTGEWVDEIDFPISVARPEIMSETARAIALEIFDELGVQEGTQRRGRSGAAKGDPLIVGRIIDPRSTTYNRRWVTFLLAWYVNTKDL